MIRALRILLVVCLSVGMIAPADRAMAGVPTDAGLQPVVYAVAINGVRVAEGALLLMTAGRELYARADDLRSWRINVPAGIPAVLRGAVRYVALRSLPGIRSSLDPATQTLLLQARPTALRGSEIGLGALPILDVARPAGAYANYAFTESGGSSGSSAAGEVQAGFAALGGVIKNDLAWTPGGVSRLQTSWEFDDPRRMRALTIGDATTTDTKLGSAIRFGGIAWSSDFTEQPAFATYPGVTVRGAASVPSALDIYVNDVLALRRDVPAGPYTLRDLPLLDGAGTIAVRAADALGGSAQWRAPYYLARSLLKPGLASFSYSAGFLDENGTYGPFFVDASRRWGLSDKLTGGAMAQFGAGDAIVGASTDWLAGKAGVVSLAAATSRSARGAGVLWDVGYDYGNPRLSVGAELRAASAAYASLDPTAIAIAQEVNLHAAVRLDRVTNAQLSVARDATVAGPVSLLTAGLSGSTGGFPYTVTAYRTAGAAAPAFGITASLSVPLSRRATLTPRLGTGGNSAQSQLKYAGTAGDDGRTTLAWDVAAGTTRAATSAARIEASTGFGEFDIDAASTRGSTAYSAAFGGGIAIAGGTVWATREISGAYGLVRVPGFGGIDVYVNDRYAGRTDSHGDLMTADLVPYVENEIRIDPQRLVANAQLDALTRQVVPPAFGASTIVFHARLVTEARTTLLRQDGTPLPAGALMQQVGGSGSWPVGLDGHIDLIDVIPGPLTIRSRDSVLACTIRLAIPAGVAVATLAAASCEP